MHEDCRACRVGQKNDYYGKLITSVYDEVARRSVYQNIQLFMKSQPVILNVTVFKYSLHKFRKRIPRQNTV